MERKIFIYTSLLAGFLSLVIFSSFNSEDDINRSPVLLDSSGLQQRITGFDLSKTFQFAGEPMPTTYFDPVERLDRELMINVYQHATTLMHIKSANRYFPIIEPILAKHGIPDAVKYLCVAESSFRIATSPAGAKGLWQFVDLMGRAYNLEINSEVDERFHVEKSTEAACKFLLYLKERFGSWTMAAAAYNMGETALAKKIQEQKSNSYYDLHLNEETSRYVFRILAIKEIMQHPEQYGFYVEDDQLYAPHEYKVVIVDYPILS